MKKFKFLTGIILVLLLVVAGCKEPFNISLENNEETPKTKKDRDISEDDLQKLLDKFNKKQYCKLGRPG